MIGVLLKKQFMELFRSFFYDQKKGKRRSKASTVVSVLLYGLLLVGFLGGIFTLLSLSLCGPLYENGLGWFYFTIMGVIAVALGIFGSVFSTFSGMYLAKDNDLLLSLPIPVRYILYSRLLGVYLMGLLYSGVALLPAVIVYWVVTPFSVKSVIGGVVLIVIVSLFVLALSCILGWGVAKISAKLKNKSVITVFVALAFFALYYYVYFKAGAAVGNLIATAESYAADFSRANPLCLLGAVGTGDLLSVLILAVAVVLLCVAVLAVLSRSFLKIVSANAVSGRLKKKAQTSRQTGISAALLSREFKRFTSSANYMLNCGLGTLMILVCAVLFLVKGGTIREALLVAFGTKPQLIPVLLVGLLCFLISMNDTAAASVSLEGKTLWIARSLPVDSWRLLLAKLELQWLITGIPILICVICGAAVLHLPFGMAVLMAAFALAFTALSACFGLFLNLKKPNLTWTNEVIPIKQSACVLFSMLGCWFFGIVVAAVYFLLSVVFPAAVYLGIFLVIVAALCAWLLVWLRKQGVARFEAL